MSNERCFKDFEEFANFVGLLDQEFYDKNDIGIEPDNGAGFSTHRLSELRGFCKRNPEYHIITDTSDFDSFDSGRGVTMDNGVRFVNRLDYWLGNKSSDDCFLSEEWIVEEEVG